MTFVITILVANTIDSRSESDGRRTGGAPVVCKTTKRSTTSCLADDSIDLSSSPSTSRTRPGHHIAGERKRFRQLVSGSK
ncbi:hypothetical protein RESH_01992 [Rhodopirellula europaea SH398]|uniref:Uncharacterized protein n=1 Tax=Rhodopirellula europaea SH398 TaxID=1263868 RepID=M5S7W4_9BACT|nr:hypothetical protein RESH_01992 [Rhodopirellula europaea SH398]